MTLPLPLEALIGKKRDSLWEGVWNARFFRSVRTTWEARDAKMLLIARPWPWGSLSRTIPWSILFLLHLPIIMAVGHSTCPQIFKPTVRKTIMRLALHSPSCLCPLSTSLYFPMRSSALPHATAYSHPNIYAFFHIVMDVPWTRHSLLVYIPLHSSLALWSQWIQPFSAISLKQWSRKSERNSFRSIF